MWGLETSLKFSSGPLSLTLELANEMRDNVCTAKFRCRQTPFLEPKSMSIRITVSAEDLKHFFCPPGASIPSCMIRES